MASVVMGTQSRCGPLTRAFVPLPPPSLAEKTKSYFTNASQVSLAILALCLENQEVTVNVAHYFVSFIVSFDAPEARNMTI
ncbi:hypothetical protein chiPu_0032415, partial [Chiloscyllium punctatum]|nr:hypothetical protein [Chiloscyllium punctatum]